jgi:UPF0716 protein FxsA
MWLFVVFVLVPIIEIALFIKVGGLIGLWPTLAIGGDPISPIAHGALILVAGVLLLTPGFFTDSLGLALLIPPVRVQVIRWIGQRIAQGDIRVYSSESHAPRRRSDDGTLEGDYTVVDEEPAEKGDSGWTKP